MLPLMKFVTTDDQNVCSSEILQNQVNELLNVCDNVGRQAISNNVSSKCVCVWENLWFLRPLVVFVSGIAAELFFSFLTNAGSAEVVCGSMIEMPQRKHEDDNV